MKTSNHKTLKENNLRPRNRFPQKVINQQKTFAVTRNHDKPNKVTPTPQNLKFKGNPPSSFKDSFRPRHMFSNEIVLVFTFKWRRW